jgi:sulfate adenylyltransferase large subunit
MAKNTFKIVFTGHVDHGKSTLIGRLLIDTKSLPDDKLSEIKKISAQLGKEAELAYVTDYLKEEREQNITIDTTQIFFRTSARDYVIIDAPGHVEFIKNMITGTSQAEAAVLLVDASEGVLEQTKRHAYLINMLGLEKVIVAVNKMDLVNYSENIFNEVAKEVGYFLEELSLKPVFTVPVSAKEDVNISVKPSVKSRKMKWYKGPSFLKALSSLKIDRDNDGDKPLRFPVQDVYTIGNEKIAVGRIESGRMFKDQSVVCLPSGSKNSVCSIRVFGKEKKRAEAQESIGIVMKDLDSIKRGIVVVGEQDKPELSDKIKASVFWMKDEPLSLQERLEIRCSTQEVDCGVEVIDRKIDSSTLEVIEDNIDKLLKYEVGEVYIRTRHPIAVEKFGYSKELGGFILKHDGDVAGVGIVR